MAATYREYNERAAEKENQRLYLQGAYTFNAVMAAVEIAMWNGKGKRPEGYLKHPIPLTKREIEEDKKRKMERTLAWFAQGQEE